MLCCRCHFITAITRVASDTREKTRERKKMPKEINSNKHIQIHFHAARRHIVCVLLCDLLLSDLSSSILCDGWSAFSAYGKAHSSKKSSQKHFRCGDGDGGGGEDWDLPMNLYVIFRQFFSFHSFCVSSPSKKGMAEDRLIFTIVARPFNSQMAYRGTCANKMTVTSVLLLHHYFITVHISRSIHEFPNHISSQNFDFYHTKSASITTADDVG